MKILDTHSACLLHTEPFGNDLRFLLVKLYITDSNDLIIEQSKNFDQFQSFHSGQGDFTLKLEPYHFDMPDFLFNVTPNNGWTDFSITQDNEYRKFQSFILNKKLLESLPINSQTLPKHKI